MTTWKAVSLVFWLALLTACPGAADSGTKSRIEELVQRGLLLEEAHLWRSAIDVSKEVLELDPKNVAAMNTIAGLYGILGEYHQEVTWALRALEVDPRFELAHINHGNGLAGLDRIEEAEAAFRKAAELAPQSPLPVYSLGVLAENQGSKSDNGLSMPVARGDEDPIEALMQAPLRTQYADDGAADATVTETPIPEVRRLVDLHDEAVRLLIACLDDSRPTQAVYVKKSQLYPVPLGHVCLDILTHVVSAPQILYEDCYDDGLGACVAQPFYYEPGIMLSKDSGKSMGAVKSRWAAAYREGKVKFVYPSWWY